MRARVKGINGAKAGGFASLLLGILFGLISGLLAFIGVRLNDSDFGCLSFGLVIASLFVFAFAIAAGIVGGTFIVFGILGLVVGYKVGRSFRMGKKWKLRKYQAG